MATLADLARQYLNQRLPDISGIFTLPQASGIMGSTITTPNVVPVQGLTPEQLALLYPQNQGGGDGDGPGTGFGLFNNLDENDVRYEVVNGELVPTYRNVTSGLYQTVQGKNISNLGLSTPTSSFLDGIFGAKTPPQFPGYFQQDPETRGKFIDYITGKTRRDKLEQFRIDQIEKASNISGAEDPSDYLQRKRREEDLQQMRGPIGRSDPAPGTGSGGGGSPAQQAATRSKDLRGGPGKNYGPYG